MEMTPVPPRSILVIVIGFALWGAAFVTLYAVNAIGCAFGWPPALQRGVIVGLAVAASGTMIAVTVWSAGHWRKAANAGRPAPSLARIGALGSAAALGATIFVFVPSVFVSMCV
ncbi:hypothetical protein [Pelagibacterium sp.]|uniref:hypothetical protein n=2 Tax=Pelagibacterium sp. TaxID=1967288 RepID=UPI003BA84D4E